jgi:large subunit ribosomal protein L25
MADIELDANVRQHFGKGFARRLRADRRTPAVIYSQGEIPSHIDLDTHELELALKHSNALFEIRFGDQSRIAIVREIQKHPVKRTLVHVDFNEVRRGEQIRVEIPIRIVGEPLPHVLSIVENDRIDAMADPFAIPEFIEVSIEGLDAGASIHASDVELPPGVTLLSDAEFNLVSFQVEKEEAEEAEAPQGGDEGTEAAGESAAEESEA